MRDGEARIGNRYVGTEKGNIVRAEEETVVWLVKLAGVDGAEGVVLLGSTDEAFLGDRGGADIGGVDRFHGHA